MSNQEEIMNEILTTTRLIQNEFPALYEHLNETPLFLSYQEKEIRTVDFEQYLESIERQLISFERATLCIRADEWVF